MNFIDIFILLILIYGTVKGVIRGFIVQFFSLLGVVLGIYVAKSFASKIALVITDWTSISLSYSYYLAYFILFCVVIFSCHVVAKLLAKSIKFSFVSWLNTLLGALIGLLKYAFVLSICINVYQGLDKKEKLIKQNKKESSLLYKPVRQLVPKVMPYVKDVFDKEKESN